MNAGSITRTCHPLLAMVRFPDFDLHQQAKIIMPDRSPPRHRTKEIFTA
jgi:hypothetical protein